MFGIIFAVFYLFRADCILSFHDRQFPLKLGMVYYHLLGRLKFMLAFMLLQSSLKFLILLGQILDDLLEFLDFLLNLGEDTFCDLIWMRDCLYYDSIVLALGAFTWSYYLTRPRNCLEKSQERVVLFISGQDLKGERQGLVGVKNCLCLLYIA